MKRTTAAATMPKSTISPMAVGAAASVRTPLLMRRMGEQVQSTTPIPIFLAYCLMSSRYSLPRLKLIFIDGFLLSSLIVMEGADFSLIPSSLINSSIFPNSEMTIPMASFSLLPSAFSSTYLSSIIEAISPFAFLTSSVSGSCVNMLSK